jgi:hypothetical protein
MARKDRFKTPQQRSSSKGEKDLYNILKLIYPLHLTYSEYPYAEFCGTDNNRLRADIYDKTAMTVWEMEGEHHFNSVPYGNTEEDIAKAKEQFEERKRLDKLKIKLCEDAGITLIKIDHKEWEKLKDDKEKILFVKRLLYPQKLEKTAKVITEDRDKFILKTILESTNEQLVKSRCVERPSPDTLPPIERSKAATPEPPPIKGNVIVLPYVIEDLKARAEMGKNKYGTYLEINNGRDSLNDLYQEMIDGIIYLKQFILERNKTDE